MTVAWFHVSRSDIGAPTILLRPSTTALLPLISVPVTKNPFSMSYIVKGKMVGLYDYQEILFLPTPWMSEGLFLPSFPGIIIKMAISREAASVRFYKSGSLIKFYSYDV